MAMTRDEIIEVLQIASLWDGREIDAAMVMAWSESARIANWSLREATQAVKDHQTYETTYLKAAHVTQRIRASRQQPRPVGEVLALRGPAPASARKRAEVMARVHSIAEARRVPRD